MTDIIRSDIHVSVHGWRGRLSRKTAGALRYNDLVMHQGELRSIREITVGDRRQHPPPQDDDISVLISSDDGFTQRPDDEVFDVVPFDYVVASYRDGRVEILDVEQCTARRWKFGARALAVVLHDGEMIEAGESGP
jgi:hypothetical protein